MNKAPTSRRAALAALAGASAAWPMTVRGQGQSDPPAFDAGRHQYTLLRPVRDASAIRLTGLAGDETPLARFRGKVLLVNFWATWCAACRTELPALDRLQVALGTSDVEIAAVATDRGGRAVVAPFLRQLNIRRLKVYLDPDARVGRINGDGIDSFALYGLPMTYVVGRAGQIHGYIVGDADWTSDAARALIEYYRRAEG